MSTKLPDAIRRSLSAARLATYEQAALAAGCGAHEALPLYVWNTQVCAAFLTPLHFCEVVLRNAAADAVEAIHGPRWPWNLGFERSLPRHHGLGYSALADLQAVRRKAMTSGQAIAEFKFVFWEKLFTSRHDGRIWNSQLRRVMPNLEHGKSVADHRSQIFDSVNDLRHLRNRIAHHEPIHARNLIADFDKIHHLVNARCQISAEWMLSRDRIMAIIAAKPF
jgi:hypothetical protein